jgi:hypothetical protein
MPELELDACHLDRPLVMRDHHACEVPVGIAGSLHLHSGVHADDGSVHPMLERFTPRRVHVRMNVRFPSAICFPVRDVYRSHAPAND